MPGPGILPLLPFTAALIRPERLADGGPVYHETRLDQLVVEPFNAASALLFLGIVVYWLTRLRGRFAKERFLTFSLAVMGIGGVGGTLYHAFRVSRWFLLMDWLPIAILVVAAAVYFYRRLLRRGWHLWLIMAGLMGTSGLIFLGLRRGLGVSDHVVINVNYSLMGIFVAVPFVWWLSRTDFAHGRYVLFAVATFAMAVFCRVADPWALMPMGTHFLWHTFGALTAHLMIAFLFHIRQSGVKVAEIQGVSGNDP